MKRFRDTARTGLLTFLLPVLGACGSFEPQPGGPVLEYFEFYGQLPDDPWTLVFVFDFLDEDGDLSEGVAEFYAGSAQTPLEVELSNVFLANDLDLRDTAGTASVALNLDAEVQDGQQVNIALVLVDGAGRRSNRYEVTLQFKVGAGSTGGER